MMKLRYLFEDFDLAKQALGRWPHDRDGQDALLAQYRISSNAIYPFASAGGVFLLRLAPEEEKVAEDIHAELEFVEYLRAEGYPALRFVPSIDGRRVERVEHDGIAYHATVSARVPGVQLGRVPLNPVVVEEYGKMLGWLHRLSAQYTPVRKRKGYGEALDWIEQALKMYGAPPVALNEAVLVRQMLDALPRSSATFGLIHYDFELDNVFYDEKTGAFHVIDFDDSMYHFFAMDIQQALDSLREEMDTQAYPECEVAFLRGYSTEHALDAPWLSMPVFGRFARLNGYARCLRSLYESFDEEPEWMLGLRARLGHVMQETVQGFGQSM